MTTLTPSEKKLNQLFFGAGLILQILFFIAAVILFKERMLYADTAHFTAEITGSGSFYLGHRLIAVISRILPVSSTFMGASISTSLILYSINLALIFVIPYLLIAYKFKDRKMALVLLLFQFVFMYRTFYIPISELQHGLVFLILYWGYIYYLNNHGRRPSRNLRIYLLLIIIMNTHPIIMFAFIASCLVLSEHKAYWSDYDQKLLIPCAALFYIISSIIFYTKYEAAILIQALGQSENGINVYYIRLMISTLIRDYYPALAVSIVGAGMLLRKYSWKKALLILVFIASNLLFVYLRFANTTFTITFFEIYLQTIPFMLFLVVAIQLHHYSRRTRMIGIGGVIIIMLFQGYRVLEHRKFYQERLAVYSGVFDEMKEKGVSKAILPFYNAPMNKIIDFYASPFESYLFSYLDSDPANDGFIITYLSSDSVVIDGGVITSYIYTDPETTTLTYKLKNNNFITLGVTDLNYYPFSDYPKFDISQAPYKTF